VFAAFIVVSSVAVYYQVDNIIFVPLLSLLSKSLIEQVISNTANNYKILLDSLLIGLMSLQFTAEKVPYTRLGYVNLIGLIAYTAYGMFFDSVDLLYCLIHFYKRSFDVISPNGRATCDNQI